MAALALHAVRRRARQRRMMLLVDHRAFPRELLERRATPMDVVDGEITAITTAHPDLQWASWSGPDTGYPVTTLLAMEAVQAAKQPESGGLPASDQLDAALRHAFLVQNRCISLYTVIVEVARTCPLVDTEALVQSLVAGTGRAQVMAQWVTAAGDDVVGSPHLFTAGGFDEYSPGGTVSWPDGPGGGPVLEPGSADWVDRLLDTL
jgi:hypothetical protein